MSGVKWRMALVVAIIRVVEMMGVILSGPLTPLI
jgi:hypothetical protein